MESSECSSSDNSSSTSDSTVTVQTAIMLNSSMMSSAPLRSQSEVKQIEEAVTSLMNLLDFYRPRLADTQYAYFCKYSKDYLISELDKKMRKTKKLSNTTINFIDSSSVAESVRSGSSAPLYQLCPPNANVPPIARFARPPSAVPSTSRDYSTLHPFELPSQRYFKPTDSSGYSSGVNSNGFDNAARYNPQRRLNRQHPVAKSQNETLMQAIDEEDSSPPELARSRPNNRPTRLNVPSTTNSSAEDSDNSDTQVKKKKIVAVPKQRNSVIKLMDWSIKLVGEDLFVCGSTTDESQVTSKAVTKYSHPIVITTNGQFQVVGSPFFGERVPAYIESACSKGFPRQWKCLSKKWLAERQARETSRKDGRRTPLSENKRAQAPRRRSKSLDSVHLVKSQVNNSAPKASPNNIGKAGTAKAANAKKPGMNKQKKNECSPGSQSDKENKTTGNQSKSTETSRKDGRRTPLSKNKRAQAPRRRSKSLDSVHLVKSQETVERVKSNLQQRTVTKKNKKLQRMSSDDEDESDSNSPLPAKLSKVVKSRINSCVKSKERKPETSDDEDESDSDSPPPAKQSKVVKSRTNSCVKSSERKPETSDDEGESDSDESVIEPSINPAKRAVQERGSDTSWDTSERKHDTPTPRAPSKKVSTTKKGTTNRQPATKAAPKKAVPDKTKDLGKAAKTNMKAKPGLSSNHNQPPSKKDNVGSKNIVDIFGDKPSRSGYVDALSAMGGEDLFSVPLSRSMTPNTLVASIQPDAGMIGRYTPPLQALGEFFPDDRNSKANSSFGSPTILNNSRDTNHVSKRMAKDVVEASKKGGKKKQKLPDFEVHGELDDLVKSLKNNNTVKTPTIVKKVFRNQRDTDDESVISDKEESLVY